MKTFLNKKGSFPPNLISSWDDNEVETNTTVMNKRKSLSSSAPLSHHGTKKQKVTGKDNHPTSEYFSEITEGSEDEFTKDFQFEYEVEYLQLLQKTITKVNNIPVKVILTFKGNKISINHARLNILTDAQREYSLGKVKVVLPQRTLHADGLKIIFRHQEDVYELAEYLKNRKEYYDRKITKGRGNKMSSHRSERVNTDPRNHLSSQSLSKSNQRYASPNKSVTISRVNNPPTSTAKVEGLSTPIKSPPSKYSRTQQSGTMMNITPTVNRTKAHRDFSPSAFRQNFEQMKDVAHTVSEMNKRSYIPHHTSQQTNINFDDDEGEDNKVSFPNDDFPNVEGNSDVLKSSDLKTSADASTEKSGLIRQQYGKQKSIWSLMQNSQTFSTSPTKEYKMSTDSMVSDGINSNSNAQKESLHSLFANTSTKAASSKPKPKMSLGSVFGTVKQPKTTPSVTKSVEDYHNSLFETDSMPSDLWSPTSTPAFAHSVPIPDGLIKSKQLNSFYDRSSTVASSILHPSFATSSFVKTVFKGGIRNLGNSCYISAVIQCLLCLYELLEDLNSPFWSNIVESQLLLDSTDPKDTTLVETLLFYNDHSCLREFLALIRQKLAYDQENIQKAAYIESSISILPGGKDIFDLTNLKRTVGKLIPQFANYSQQDGQEFFLRFIDQLEVEMSTRLQYYLLQCSKIGYPIQTSSLVVPMTPSTSESGGGSSSGHDSTTTERKGSSCDESNRENSYTYANEALSLMQSPPSITNVPKTTAKEKPVSPTSKTSHHEPCSSTISESGKAVNHGEENSETKIWQDRKFLQSLSQELLPSHYYLDTIIEVQMTCMGCQTIFPPKQEHYRDFSLELDTLTEIISPSISGTNNPSTLSLDLLIANFFKDEICDWNCEYCVKPQKVAIRRRILSLAKILIIHLKRFHYSMETNTLGKIDRKVSFQLSYDLSKYLQPLSLVSTDSSSVLGRDQQYHQLWKTNPLSILASEKPSSSIIRDHLSTFMTTFHTIKSETSIPEQQREHPKEEINRPKADYELVGIIRHLGADLSLGHYICDVKNPFTMKKVMVDPLTNEEIKWIRYNDTVANPIKEETMLSETDTPYMFILHRK